MYKFYYCIILSLFLFAACEEEALTDQAAGFRIALREGKVSLETKSAPSELGTPATDKFNLRIVRDGASDPLYDGSYTDRTIPAPAGSYTIAASYGDNPILALDEPYYLGDTSSVEILKGEQKSVSLNCKLANALASVYFPEGEEELKKLNAVFSSYWVRVKVGDLSCQLFPQSGYSAYFRAGEAVSFYFGGTKKNGQEYSEKKLEAEDLPSTLAAGDHLMLTLTLDLSDGQLDISKVKVKKETIASTIPLEWLPKPKIEPVGFVNNKTLYVAEGATVVREARLNIAVAHPLQDLSFHMDMGEKNPLNGDYKLSALEADTRDLLKSAGFVLPEIGDEKPVFNLRTLTANRLKTDNGAERTITISNLVAKANNRESEVGEYEIAIVPLVYDLAVYPGNKWTKEFTATATYESGSEEAYNATTIQYEYSADGGKNWLPTTAQATVTGLTPGTTYQLRANCLGVVKEIKEVKTYEALAIPNSSLNDGYETSYPKKDNPLYTFKGGWIDTRNALTCHTDGVNAFYVSKSSTLPVNENGSTVAYMMTIGWGDGNTCAFGGKGGSVIYNISSGIVCVGDYDISNGSIKAKEAYIKPTSISFTYKASPYKDDQYLMEIQLVNITDDKETIIGTASFKSGEQVKAYQTKTMDITYDEAQKGLDISHVRILVKAGTKEDRDHLEDKFRDASIWDGYANAYIIGSQFWLDSFNLIYDK